MFSRGRCTLPAITLQTINAFLIEASSSHIAMDSKALPLVEVVKTPTPSFSSLFVENPSLIIRHTQHLSDTQRLEDPLMPSEHASVVHKTSRVHSHQLGSEDASSGVYWP
ncbi:UNVERIFIED_CONTAM: hypothetical protein Sradi_6987800 [Sesamum radiatum]|uniref:Uncharacterized protein n=1 Tax=Sesamum radiatum TaxID=300843 RepID=A0AAW2JE03_SESRA